MRLLLITLLSLAGVVSAATYDTTKSNETIKKWTEVYNKEIVQKSYALAAETIRNQGLINTEVGALRYAQLIAAQVPFQTTTAQAQTKAMEAIEAYRKAIATDPSNVSVKFAGLEYVAIRDKTTLVLLDPKNVSFFAHKVVETSDFSKHYRALNLLVESEFQLGNWKEAAKFASVWSNTYPGDLDAQVWAVRTLEKMGQTKDSAVPYQRIAGLTYATNTKLWNEAASFLNTTLAGK